MKRLSRRSVLGMALLASTANLRVRGSFAQELSFNGIGLFSNIKPDAKFYAVRFWSFAALDMIALDHSVKPEQAIAPGPCASSLALALVHAAIADAARYAYGARYEPQFHKGAKPGPIDHPAAFVGGAAFRVLTAIFENSPLHESELDARKGTFRRALGEGDLRVPVSWKGGQDFVSAEFLKRWDAKVIKEKLFQDYDTKPGKHNVDPFNKGQGFYGAGWGSHPPLVLTASDVNPDKGPLAPPPPPAITPKEIAFVKAKGGLNPVDVDGEKARTGPETNIGLFWAYDGARYLGTPPVLYNEILWQYADTDTSMTDASVARLLALCNIAMADGGIVAWASKYFHEVWRPVRAIYEMGDTNWHPLGAPRTNSGLTAPGAAEFEINTTQVLLGATRLEALPSEAAPAAMEVVTGTRKIPYPMAAFTPNFPAYPSGHATFGGACFEMLRLIRKETLISEGAANRIRLRGVRSGEVNRRVADNIISRDNFTGIDRDKVLMNFHTIDDLDMGNSISRVFLGVHWTFDSTEGSASGKKIANRVFGTAYGPTV
ncbi:vanadium-dependent haloperoxidase [Mesorhizobium sp. BHbdii]